MRKLSYVFFIPFLGLLLIALPYAPARAETGEDVSSG